jgi:hypothetical protein
MLEFERIYLPESMRPFTDINPLGTKEFIVEDNRGAVSTLPYLKMDATDFYLSIKGIGSTTNPFFHQLLDKAEICNLLKDSKLKDRIVNSEGIAPRYLTGELWLRGSPFGGQGLEHATASMRVSEMADLSSVNGFRAAPVVKIVLLLKNLRMKSKKYIFLYIRSIHPSHLDVSEITVRRIGKRLLKNHAHPLLGASLNCLLCFFPRELRGPVSDSFSLRVTFLFSPVYRLTCVFPPNFREDSFFPLIFLSFFSIFSPRFVS